MKFKLRTLFFKTRNCILQWMSLKNKPRVLVRRLGMARALEVCAEPVVVIPKPRNVVVSSRRDELQTTTSILHCLFSRKHQTPANALTVRDKRSHFRLKEVFRSQTPENSMAS
eukprot:c9128_g1_i1.p2 GENE.c9128_g1_i1~~c9128_g1_i1.p2  ORF type:complete len:113 (+),score=12.36 c9128_g1_i1:3-341(+)